MWICTSEHTVETHEETEAKRMLQKQRSSHPLLMSIWIRDSSMETGVEIIQNLKVDLPHDASVPLHNIYLRKPLRIW